MPAPAFHRKLSADQRAAFDAEIRRCCYADLSQLIFWLSKHAISVQKTAVHKYVQRLKHLDDVLHGTQLKPEIAKCVLEFAASVFKSITAFKALLNAIAENDKPKSGDRCA